MKKIVLRGIIGALLGVPFGALIGGSGLQVVWAITGAVLGGALGALLGVIVGNFMDRVHEKGGIPTPPGFWTGGPNGG
jgi:membrane protein YqaA with SNARE-associated domain